MGLQRQHNPGLYRDPGSPGQGLDRLLIGRRLRYPRRSLAAEDAEQWHLERLGQADPMGQIGGVARLLGGVCMDQPAGRVEGADRHALRPAGGDGLRDAGSIRRRVQHSAIEEPDLNRVIAEARGFGSDARPRPVRAGQGREG